MSTKKKSTARKKAALNKAAGKHNSQKKIQSKRVMALNHLRDSLRQAERVASSDEATDRPFRPKHPAIGSTPQSQVENAVKSGPDSADPLAVASDSADPLAVASDSADPLVVAPDSADPLAVAEEPAPIVTAFESQMHLFAMMLRWSPLAILLQQQALVVQMISNMQYPKKSEPTK